jgi:hypothetical protein
VRPWFLSLGGVGARPCRHVCRPGPLPSFPFQLTTQPARAYQHVEGPGPLCGVADDVVQGKPRLAHTLSPTGARPLVEMCSSHAGESLTRLCPRPASQASGLPAASGRQPSTRHGRPARSTATRYPIVKHMLRSRRRPTRAHTRELDRSSGGTLQHISVFTTTRPGHRPASVPWSRAAVDSAGTPCSNGRAANDSVEPTPHPP